MKRKVLIIMSVLLPIVSLTAMTQDKAARMKEIRQAYAEAKQNVANNGKDGNPRMEVAIVMNDSTEVSDDFVINDENAVHCYFKRIRTQGDTDLFDARCYFLTERWSSNGHTSYREMLFDPFSQQLMFSYMRAETHAGFVIESRYYYDDEGRLIEDKHKAGGSETTAEGQSWSSSVGDRAMAVNYIAMFNDLMQRCDARAESYTPAQVADKSEQMKKIRTMYAAAKQKISQDAKSDIPRNLQIEIHDQADSEMPPQKDVVKAWFEHIDDVEGARCYFFSSTCELGDHHVYSEYLFDPKTSHLLFCFSQQQQNEGPTLEWRTYFDATGRCIEAKGQAAKNGPGFADKDAAKTLLDIFNALVNPSD